MLSEQARRILRVRCANHTVAHCTRCEKEWFREELREEIAGSGGQGVLCQACGADLTGAIQRHLFGCLLTRVFRDDPQVTRAADATVRQRSDRADRDKPGLSANDEAQLAATWADGGPGEVLGSDVGGTKPVCGGGGHRWLARTAVVASCAVLVLGGVVICSTSRGSRSDAPRGGPSRVADVADGSGRSRTSPPMGARLAGALVPHRTQSVAVSAPRDVVAPPRSKHGTGFADPAPQLPAWVQEIVPHRAHSTSWLDSVMTRVQREWETATSEVRTVLFAGAASGSRAGQRSAVATLRNQPVARRSAEQIQSP
jgi:hypothetical protein